MGDYRHIFCCLCNIRRPIVPWGNCSNFGGWCYFRSIDRYNNRISRQYVGWDSGMHCVTVYIPGLYPETIWRELETNQRRSRSRWCILLIYITANSGCPVFCYQCGVWINQNAAFNLFLGKSTGYVSGHCSLCECRDTTQSD